MDLTAVVNNLPVIAMIVMALLTLAEAYTTFTESPKDDAFVKKAKTFAVNLFKRFIPGWEQKK